MKKIIPGTLCRQAMSYRSGRRILSSEIYMFIETEVYEKNNYTFFIHVFLDPLGKKLEFRRRVPIDKWGPKNMIILGQEDPKDVVSNIG